MYIPSRIIFSIINEVIPPRPDSPDALRFAETRTNFPKDDDAPPYNAPNALSCTRPSGGRGVQQQRPTGGREKTLMGGRGGKGRRGRRRGPKGLTRALKIENSKWPIFPADGTETKSRPAFIMTCIAVRAAVICTVSLQNAWVSAMRRGQAKA